MNNEYINFEEARDFVRKLQLKSISDWKKYIHGVLPNTDPRPENIPPNPAKVYYGKGWITYSDWLGIDESKINKVKSRIKFRDFVSAKEFVLALRLTSVAEWNKYCRGEINNIPPKPGDIPASPQIVYKDSGWVSFPDWLGYQYIKGKRPKKIFKVD